MCGGIEARVQDRSCRVYFPNPKAAIPVITADGAELVWVRWGRRPSEAGSHPQGGWAKFDSFERGGWDLHAPQRALALVQGHMQKDSSRNSHWFDLGPELAIECIVIGEGEQRRVYVVTTTPPQEYSWIEDRWPSVVPVSTFFEHTTVELLANQPSVSGGHLLKR